MSRSLPFASPTNESDSTSRPCDAGSTATSWTVTVRLPRVNFRWASADVTARVDVPQLGHEGRSRRVDHAVGDVPMQNADVAAIAILGRRGLDGDQARVGDEMPVLRQRERCRQLDDDAGTLLRVPAAGAERRSEPWLVVAPRLVREGGAQMHLATAPECGEWPARCLECVVLPGVAIHAAHAVH